MKALFRCEKNWQKINVQRFSANFLFSKNGKCRSITYSGDFATLPFFLYGIKQSITPSNECKEGGEAMQEKELLQLI